MTVEGSLAPDQGTGAPATQSPAAPRTTMEAFNPATREGIGHIFATSPHDIPAFVTRAREAARHWGDLAHAQRARVLARLRALVAQRADEIAATIARGMGKPLIEALSFEVTIVLQTLDDCIASRRVEPEDEPDRAPRDKDLHAPSEAQCAPRAVVCVLAPVSSPFERAMTPAVLALAQGCAVLIKPSASAPLVGVLIADLFQEALREFPSVAQVVHGDAEVGTCLATAQGIDVVVFSGARAAARTLQAALKPLSRPTRFTVRSAVVLIVCDDANLERVANATVFGRFSNNGQGSATVGWVYVQRSLADAFVHKVVHKVRALKSGPYTDPHCELGPLANGRGLEHLRALLQDALDQRATLVTGGFPPHVTGLDHGERRSAQQQGFFWPPTVVTEAGRSTRLMREEVFGPILPICVVEDDREAILFTNEAPAGSAACVFSSDIARAQRIAAELKVDQVAINALIPKNPLPGPLVADKRVLIDDGRSDRDADWFPYSAAKLKALARDPARQHAPASGLESIDA
jgi:succinate-semialdehyde dehydrogenase/glutarate-semialdehyde dehydrogenase